MSIPLIILDYFQLFNYKYSLSRSIDHFKYNSMTNYHRMSKPLKIEITGQDQSALFANDFHIMHTPNEFVLSIVEAIPQMQFSSQESINQDGKTRNVARISSSGILRKIIGRYGMSPAAFKKLVTVMNTNLKQYEDKFGAIAINPPEGLQ